MLITPRRATIYKSQKPAAEKTDISPPPPPIAEPVQSSTAAADYISHDNLEQVKKNLLTTQPPQQPTQRPTTPGPRINLLPLTSILAGSTPNLETVDFSSFCLNFIAQQQSLYRLLGQLNSHAFSITVSHANFENITVLRAIYHEECQSICKTICKNYVLSHIAGVFGTTQSEVSFVVFFSLLAIAFYLLLLF